MLNAAIAAQQVCLGRVSPAAPMEASDEPGYSTFLRACADGCPERITAVVRAGCNITARDSTGQTGLMLAAGADTAAAVQAVLALGTAGLEDKDQYGYTAFLHACGSGSVQCTAALAEAGCDMSARNIKGQTALMIAAASPPGSAAAVQTVLALGAVGLEDKDDDECTAFLLACGSGSVECIAALAEAGCDTSARNIKGQTALMIAAASPLGSAAAVQTVLTLDAVGLEDKDDDGCAAFHIACFNGSVECIAALAEAGCDKAARNGKDQTGLMLAAASLSGSAAAVQTVLALGAVGLEDKDDEGCTAFMCACGSGNIECIMALAHAGCDTFVRSRHLSVNAEGFARRGGHEDVLPSIDSAHRVQRAREAGELAADATLAGYTRAIAHLEQAVMQHGVSPEVLQLLDELREQRKQQHELAVRKAQQAEAELIAMIDGEPSVAAADAKTAEKARRTKEKRQRQKMARAPVVTAAAAAAAAPTSTPPEPPPAELLANTDAEKARKKKAKRLRQQERKAAARRAAEENVARGTETHLPTPPMMLAPAQETVPIPEQSRLERPALVELNQQPEEAPQPRELSRAAAEPALPPLAQLTVEQSVAWLGTVSGLAPDAIEAAGRSFTANEIDGEDLKTMRPTFLRFILQDCLPEAEVRDAVIATILGRRDEQLVEESTPEDCMVCPLSLCLMEDPWTTQVGSTCE
jgi:ankyrin repeat protein